MGLTPPSPPPTPDASQCSEHGGIAQTTDGGESLSIGIDYSKVIRGTSKSWTKPYAFDETLGAKIATVDGDCDETITVFKLEQIVPNESKFNLSVTDEWFGGAKYELIPTFNKELNLAVKLHVTPMHGRKWGATNISKLGHEKRELARQKEVIEKYEMTVLGTATNLFNAHEHKVGDLDREIDKLCETMNEYDAKVGSGMLDGEKRTRVTKGNETHNASTHVVEATGSVKIIASEIEIKGGGNTLRCAGGRVTWNGTDIVASL